MGEGGMVWGCCGPAGSSTLGIVRSQMSLGAVRIQRIWRRPHLHGRNECLASLTLRPMSFPFPSRPLTCRSPVRRRRDDHSEPPASEPQRRQVLHSRRAPLCFCALVSVHRVLTPAASPSCLLIFGVALLPQPRRSVWMHAPWRSAARSCPTFVGFLCQMPEASRLEPLPPPFLCRAASRRRTSRLC